MRKLATAASLAALLLIAGAPVASADPPPTDPLIVEGGGPCDPDNPCDPRPIAIQPDRTYPSRVVAWAKDQLS